MAGIVATLSMTGTSTADLSSGLSRATELITLGTDQFAALKLSLGAGTGEDQANQHWGDQITVAAGADEDLDLTALSGLMPGTTVNFSRVVAVVMAILDPDGALALQVGPQGVTNGWQGWFSDVLAANWEEVKQGLYKPNTKGATPGWTVDATHKVLRLHNPGAADVTCRIVILGV